MTFHTVYRTFHTDRRREFIRITDEELRAAVDRMTRVALMTVTAD